MFLFPWSIKHLLGVKTAFTPVFTDIWGRCLISPLDSARGRINQWLALVMIGPWLFFSGSVAAQEGAFEGYPKLSGNIINRLGYDGDYDRGDDREETNDIFVQIIASPIVHFSDRFRFISELRVETVSPPVEDRTFEDQGLFARILLAEYSITERFSVHAGKMTPSFALGSFVIPGMYGNSYNKEIELIDRVGFGGTYRFDNATHGQHTLRVNSFFEDTSVFSESLGTNRGRSSLEDGGESNTESFESFALSLEGKNLPRFPGLTYQLGLLHQGRGVDGVADEQGISISVIQEMASATGKKISLIGEIAAFDNFEGTRDQAIYASAGIVYKTGSWTTVLSGTYRPRYVPGGENLYDYTTQLSFEYDFGKGVSLGIAHEGFKDQNISSNRIGLRLSKVIELGK